MIIGESAGYSRTKLSVLNGLLTDLGVSMRSLSAEYDPKCGWGGIVVGSHPLSDGIEPIEYAWSSDIVLHDADPIIMGQSGQNIAAVEGDVVLLSDLLPVVGGCDLLAGNAVFLANLYEGPCPDPEIDADHDGEVPVVCGGSDCDDTDPTTYGGAVERCDGVDNDCDGSISGEEDSDADLFLACEDCDDADAGIYPGAPEYCDEADGDCDGVVDEDALDVSVWYRDGDGDPTVEGGACDQPRGYTDDATDCDDADGSIPPGADEAPGDGSDQDCDGADAEPEEETGDAGGCGCAAGPGGDGAWLLGLAALATLRRRGAS